MQGQCFCLSCIKSVHYMKTHPTHMEFYQSKLLAGLSLDFNSMVNG